MVVAAVLVLAFLGLSLYANQKRLDADRASRQAVAAEATAVTEAQVRSTAQAQAQASEATAIAEAHTRATAQVQAEEARATAVVEVQVRATAQAMTEEQRQVAVMRQLAAHALNVADRRLDFGLLLSVQANERAKLMEEADREREFE